MHIFNSNQFREPSWYSFLCKNYNLQLIGLQIAGYKRNFLEARDSEWNLLLHLKNDLHFEKTGRI